MPVGVKCHFKFNAHADESTGWGENWYLIPAASADLISEVNKAIGLGNLRKEMLGPGYWLQSITVSDMNNPRRYKEAAYDSSTGASSLFGGDPEAEFVEASLMVSKVSSDGVTHGRVFLRGLPGQEVGPGGSEGLGGIFLGAYNAWKANIVSQQWAFLGRTAKTADRTAKIATVSQNVDGTVHIVLQATPTSPVLTDGVRYKVGISGVIGVPQLSGSLVADYKAPLVLNSIKQVLIPPAGGLNGQVVFLDPSTIAVTGLINERIVGRKAGAAFFRLRGRAKARHR